MKTLLDQIKAFEGYTPKAQWDHKQYSIGYGTRAAGAGETITPEEAERRLNEEVSKARALVENFAPNAPEGVKAALTSLTYNAGGDWMNSGLGQEIKSGNYAGAKDNFLAYNKASGQYNQGLANRRAQEVAWFDGGMSLGGPPEAKGGNMNGGYGMSPVGAGGIAGPIHTAEPDQINSQFVDLKQPAQPMMALGGPGGPGGGFGALDFNDPQLGQAIGQFGNTLADMFKAPSPPSVQMARAQAPRVSFPTVAQILSNRRKLGNRGEGGRGL